jgi:23S rRNA (pseudouridine1915-N3)-methyltransferase
MQFAVSAVGQRMPAWVQAAWSEYARRFPRGFSLDLREIPLAKRPRNADIEALRAREGEALLASVPSGFRVIALDERGKQWSTEELAGQLERWMHEEHGVCFFIGGPDGLSQQCRQRAQNLWSLGRLTLPHPMVRAILAEQIYRAWSITQHHPYHRA